MKSNLQAKRQEKCISQAQLAGMCTNLLSKKEQAEYAGYNDWGRIMDVENGMNFDLFVSDGTASRCAKILCCSVEDLRGASE